MLMVLRNVTTFGVSATPNASLRGIFVRARISKAPPVTPRGRRNVCARGRSPSFLEEFRPRFPFYAALQIGNVRSLVRFKMVINFADAANRPNCFQKRRDFVFKDRTGQLHYAVASLHRNYPWMGYDPANAGTNTAYEHVI